MKQQKKALSEISAMCLNAEQVLEKYGIGHVVGDGIR